jgi:hypothetical protein
MARIILTGLTVVLLSGCGSRPYAGGEFGMAPLERELFPRLDSALSPVVGQSIIIHAQEDLGRTGPVARSMTGFIQFHGVLLEAERDWVAVSRAFDDTVRVSKGHITAIWRARPGASTRSMAVGAAILGLGVFAALQIQDPFDRPGTMTQVYLVSGSTLIGALLGKVLFGGARRGEQLYPPSRRRP